LDIKLMRSQGLSIREISRRTGRDRKTIAKYLQCQELPKYKPRPPRPSKLDPYKDYLRARMAEGVFNANRLFNEIKSLGYSGGKTILKDFLKPSVLCKKPRLSHGLRPSPGASPSRFRCVQVRRARP